MNPSGTRLTTIEVTMHRFVLAEFNTHRMFSRNSASSRAIPVTKQLERVVADPAWPMVWPAEQKGMQGGAELECPYHAHAEHLFRTVHGHTVDAIQEYLRDFPDPEQRLHKSLINRLMEPFMAHVVVVTSSDWQNFYNQRCHPAAMPEMRLAAEAMFNAHQASVPHLLEWGEYHLPYVGIEEQDAAGISQAIRSSVARCAAVSYLRHADGRAYEDENRVVKTLWTAQPRHESPFEHVARAARLRKAGNFHRGWLQVRHDHRGGQKAIRRVL